jgi:type II secretory pathway pseudopilin PulG
MKSQKGFTILEMVLVTVSFSTLAVIAGSNALSGMERTRQKVTLTQIRQMAGAMQVFQKEFGGYPCAGMCDPRIQFVSSNYADTSNSPVIVPDLILSIPSADGWGEHYMYQSGPSGFSTPRLATGTIAEHFCLWSCASDRTDGGGNDGSSSGSSISIDWFFYYPSNRGTLETHCYQSDIVWGDSSFLQAPAGKQKKC